MFCFLILMLKCNVELGKNCNGRAVYNEVNLQYY